MAKKVTNPNLDPHPLVAKGPEPLIVFVGYLGESPHKGYVRLFVNLDLTFRVAQDIPEDAIVASSPIVAADENSPTRFYVKAATKLPDLVEVTQDASALAFVNDDVLAKIRMTGRTLAADAAPAKGPAKPPVLKVPASEAVHVIRSAQGMAAGGANPFSPFSIPFCIC